MTKMKAPLSKFIDWEDNPRNKIDWEHVDRLAVSIAPSSDDTEINLLHDLVAAPTRDGKLAVLGGKHRLNALRKLAKAGKISGDIEIFYEHKDLDLGDPEAIRIALEENMLRLPMDVIDECDGFSRMSMSGKKPKDIALEFSLSEKTVRQRISIGQLPKEAKDLIRAGQRTLSWGQALTAADKATQKKICADIAAAPNAWKEEQDIRKFLNEDTIPEEYALFNPEAYKGPIIRDMFEGNRFRDRAEFWELQNEAIELKKQELEQAGWSQVEITHQPIEAWRYVNSDDKSEAIAIIEISPNGKVSIVEGLKPRETQAVVADNGVAADDNGEAGSDAVEEAERVSAGAIEFGRNVRSAILQTSVSTDPRKAMEIVVAGLMGHPESPFRALRARFKGDQRMRQGKAFEMAGENQRNVAKLMSGLVNPEAIASHIESLDDAGLNQLFASLVADRITFGATAAEDGLLGKVIAKAGSVRDYWSPSDQFLKALSSKELRRIALDILPPSRQKGLLAAAKSQLVETLRTAFNEAAESSPALDADSIERINSWAPEWISLNQKPATAPAEEDDFLSSFATPAAA